MSFELFRVEKTIKWDNGAMPILLSLSGQKMPLKTNLDLLLDG
jgi:hypothetical protein